MTARTFLRSICRTLAYAWAGPLSLLGLLLAALAVLSGGRAIFVDGILEAHGGALRLLLERAVPLPGGAAAMTLGHVVLGRDQRCLASTRSHERVHVRQYEIWGPLFLPAYLMAGFVAVARGGHIHRDNWFERQAESRGAA